MYRADDLYNYETHWVDNTKTGEMVQFKTKNVTLEKMFRDNGR